MTLFTDIGGAIPASSGEMLYRLSLVLIAAGWTVPGSSDGSTFSQAGVNKWVSSTAANTVGAWIRLQDPAGVVEHEFQTVTAGTTVGWRVSATAKFTGGTPSATVAPTASDGEPILGTSNTTGVAFNTAGTYRINIVAGDSTWGYSFAVFCNLTGVNTAAGGGLIYDGGLSGPSGDLAPFVCYAHASSATFATISDLGAYGASAGTAGAPFGWLNNGGTGAIWQAMQALQVYASSGNFACWPPATNGMGQDPQNSSDTLIPVIWGCDAGHGLTGLKGFKGFSKFLSMDGVTGRSHGTIVLVGSQNYVMVNGATSNGYIMIPWPNGTAPLA